MNETLYLVRATRVSFIEIRASWGTAGRTLRLKDETASLRDAADLLVKEVFGQMPMRCIGQADAISGGPSGTATFAYVLELEGK